MVCEPGIFWWAYIFLYMYIYRYKPAGGGRRGGKKGGGGWKAYTPVDLIQAEKYTIKAFQNNNIIRVQDCS